MRLSGFTVHHKNDNHDDSPPDGSNGELRCLYCHDNEHKKYLDAISCDRLDPEGGREQPATHRSFAGLDDLLKKKITQTVWGAGPVVEHRQTNASSRLDAP
jgi:hypothetical protein